MVDIEAKLLLLALLATPFPSPTCRSTLGLPTSGSSASRKWANLDLDRFGRGDQRVRVSGVAAMAKKPGWPRCGTQSEHEPRNGASPKAKIPPSAPSSQ